MIKGHRWRRIPDGWELTLHGDAGRVGTLTLLHTVGSAVVSVNPDDVARELLHLVDVGEIRRQALEP